MATIPYNLAEINVARLRAPLNDPGMTEFVGLLDEINALADADPEFVWRLMDESGRASSYLQPFDDPMKIINISVWRSLEGLRRFVYKSHHTEIMRRRSEWLERSSEPSLALWWMKKGAVPNVADALNRLHYLQTFGPAPFAFNFKYHFPRKLVTIFPRSRWTDDHCRSRVPSDGRPRERSL